MTGLPACPEGVPVTSAGALGRLAREAADGFLDVLKPKAPFAVACEVVEEPPTGPAAAVTARREGDRLILRLSLPALRGISGTALRGWVERELGEAALEARLGPRRFNFKRQILPLMPVSGAAVAFIRDVVERLDRTLLRYLATEELLGLGRAEAQVDLACRLLADQVEPEGHYVDAFPHAWVRALFLCRKAREHAGLVLLAGAGLEGAGAVRREWEERNRLTSDDRRLLEDLVAASGRGPDQPYGDRLVGLFQVVRPRLLGAGAPPEEAGTVH